MLANNEFAKFKSYLFTVVLITTIINFINHDFYNQNISLITYIIDDFIINFSVLFAFVLFYSIYKAFVKSFENNNLEDLYKTESISDEESEEDSNNDLEKINNKSTIEKKLMSLKERMKYYETESSGKIIINGSETFAIRLDGRCFSKITQYFEKPYDEKFSEVMLKTANAIFKEFHPTMIHVQNDEINIIFKNRCSKKEYEIEPNKYKHLFGGKVNKILTILSSFASAKMFYFLNELVNENIKYIELKDNIKNINIAFDSKIIMIPENKNYEAINYIFWRSTIDGYRNTVSLFANQLFKNNELTGVSTEDRIKKIRTNYNFEEMKNNVKYGWIIKYISNKKTTKAISFKINYSEEVKELLLNNISNLDILNKLNNIEIYDF